MQVDEALNHNSIKLGIVDLPTMSNNTAASDQCSQRNRTFQIMDKFVVEIKF